MMVIVRPAICAAAGSSDSAANAEIAIAKIATSERDG
jgi:hypothetical protein